MRRNPRLRFEVTALVVAIATVVATMLSSMFPRSSTSEAETFPILRPPVHIEDVPGGDEEASSGRPLLPPLHALEIEPQPTIDSAEGAMQTWTAEHRYVLARGGCASTRVGEFRRILEERGFEVGNDLDRRFNETPADLLVYVCAFTAPLLEDLLGMALVPRGSDAIAVRGVAYGMELREILVHFALL